MAKIIGRSLFYSLPLKSNSYAGTYDVKSYDAAPLWNVSIMKFYTMYIC